MSRWNRQGNGTNFQSALRFQAGLSSLWVSFKRALENRTFFLSDVFLLSNYHRCKRETIQLITYYMVDIICNTGKPSHLKKNTNHAKYKKPNVPSHRHIFWLSFDKANIVSSTLLCCFGKQTFEECCLGEWVISFCPGRDDKNVGASFEWERGWVKMPQINAFSMNMNSINLKIFLKHGGI